MKKTIKLLVLLLVLGACSNYDSRIQYENIKKKSEAAITNNQDEVNQTEVDSSTTSQDNEELINTDVSQQIDKDKLPTSSPEGQVDKTEIDDDQKENQADKANNEETPEPVESETQNTEPDQETPDVIEKETLEQTEDQAGDKEADQTLEAGKDSPDKTIEENNSELTQDNPDQVVEEPARDEDNKEGTQELLAPNTIYYDGDSVGYLDIGIDNYNVKRTQSYIDDGNIISTVTKFNPNDNEITYFSGHSYNFNNVARLGISSVVTITDANGVGYKYKIVDYKKYPAGVVDEGAPFIGGYHLIDLAGEGIGTESIVIQYCDENDVPIIFFGLPS